MFNSFPSIEQFHNIIKFVNKFPEGIPTPIKYYMKPKLHGTNAGVTITKDGQVFAQSRTTIITPEKDNYGFAKFVAAHSEYFSKLYSSNGSTTIFGEWYGKGIQKGVAASEVVTPRFAIFAVQINFDEDQSSVFVIDPKEIKRVLEIDGQPEHLEVLPLINTPLVVNLFNPTSVEEFVKQVNEITLLVEKCDPYIKQTHGIDGIGEGIVLYPNLSGTRDFFSKLMFKSKGQKHENVVKKKREPTTVDPELVKNINDFIKMFVTEARLTQIAERAVNNNFDLAQTGAFLQAFNQDVFKESVAELEHNMLQWKEVQGAVAKAARTWWIERCKRI